MIMSQESAPSNPLTPLSQSLAALSTPASKQMDLKYRPDLRTYVLASVFVAIASIWYSSVCGKPVFPVDDAYITLHNAQVLLWGHDPCFPGISALVGATSAVHLVVVWLLLHALAPEESLYIAAWIGVLAYVLGLVRLGSAHSLNAWQTAMLVALARIIHKSRASLDPALKCQAEFEESPRRTKCQLTPRCIANEHDVNNLGEAILLRNRSIKRPTFPLHE